MRTNRVKQQLREGLPSIGTWLSLPDPFAAQMVAHIGFDWVNVDMEHSPITIETAALMFQTIAQAGSIPLVRVPWNTPENVKRVLDAGAWGIVFPMQNTAEEAERAVAAMKYPPRGIRSAGGWLHGLSFGTDSQTYFERANDETLVVIQIEHIRAVENAEAIMSVPGIDAVFIGPNDLTYSMGLKPSLESDDPRVVEAIDHVRAVAAARGVAPGIHVFTAEAANRRLAEGFRFIALAGDLRFLSWGAEQTLAGVKRT